MGISEERRALWAAQGLEDSAGPAIEASLRSQARAAAAMWAGFCVFLGVLMAFALQVFAVVVAAVMIAACLYGLVRVVGQAHSERTATLRDKFITRKKRREYLVFGDRSIRVGRSIYDRMTVGARYRIYANGCGGVVFDLATDDG